MPFSPASHEIDSPYIDVLIRFQDCFKNYSWSCSSNISEVIRKIVCSFFFLIEKEEELTLKTLFSFFFFLKDKVGEEAQPVNLGTLKEYISFDRIPG